MEFFQIFQPHPLNFARIALFLLLCTACAGPSGSLKPERHPALEASSGGQLSDSTDYFLESLEKVKGLVRDESKTFQIGSQQVHIYLTAEARRILDQKDFATGSMALADPNFAQDRFLGFVRNKITNSITSFNQEILNSQAILKEIFIVLDDLQANTFSQTKPQSRIIFLDVRKWHEIQIQRSKDYVGNFTSYHEFTHLVNYRLDVGDDRLTRERMAVLGEQVQIQNLYEPMDPASFAFYLVHFAHPISQLAPLKNDGSPDMDVIRWTVFTLSKGLKDGTYRYAGSSADKAARVGVLGRCLADTLQDQLTGEASFDSAFKKEGLQDSSGAALTWKKLETDLMQSLVSAKPASQ